MALRLHRLAVAEIDAAVDWYEARRPALGTELEDEIDRLLERISHFPLAAPAWRERPNRRVAVVSRFPFTLPYRISVDEIVVLALAHASRRPGYWRARR